LELRSLRIQLLLDLTQNVDNLLGGHVKEERNNEKNGGRSTQFSVTGLKIAGKGGKKLEWFWGKRDSSCNTISQRNPLLIGCKCFHLTISSFVDTTMFQGNQQID
jgi:hypothetical protein